MKTLLASLSNIQQWGLAILITLITGIRYATWGGMTHGDGRGFPWLFIRNVTGTDVVGYIGQNDKIFGITLGIIGLVLDILFWYIVLIGVRLLVIQKPIFYRTRFLVIIFCVMVSVAAFYWLSFRPALAVQTCRNSSLSYCRQLQDSINPFPNISFTRDDRISECYVITQWEKDRKCLAETGIPMYLTSRKAACSNRWDECYFFIDLPQALYYTVGLGLSIFYK